MPPEVEHPITRFGELEHQIGCLGGRVAPVADGLCDRVRLRRVEDYVKFDPGQRTKRVRLPAARQLRPSARAVTRLDTIAPPLQTKLKVSDERAVTPRRI